MIRKIKRGDIFYADLNPVIGSEQGGVRPVLIVQNNVGNIHSPTLIVAAVTSRYETKAKLPTHVALDGVEGLKTPSLALLEQLRTIDRRRLRSFVGSVDESTVQEINRALAVSVGLNITGG